MTDAPCKSAELDHGVVETQDGFVSRGSANGYANALGRWLEWHIQEDDTPNLICLSDSYAGISADDFRPLLKARILAPGVPDDDAWPFHPDADLPRLLMRFLQSLKVDPTRGSAATTLGGYRSAVTWLFKKFKRKQVVITPDFADELSRFMGGSKRGAARAGGLGATPHTDDKGKALMFPALYFVLCEVLAHEPFADGIFGWSYQTMLWNLMSRPAQPTSIHVNHVYWEADAMYIRFSHTKGDQVGERAHDRAIYSNPINPEVSATLAFSVYWASTDWLSGPEHADGQVYPKASDARFAKVLERTVERPKVRALLEDEGVPPDKVKGASSRKGSRTTAETDAPTGAAHDRGDWKKDGVDGVYHKFSKINDQRIGRIVTLIPLHDPRFSILPPHWKRDAACDPAWVAARDAAFPPAALDRLVATSVRAHTAARAMAVKAGFRVITKATTGGVADHGDTGGGDDGVAAGSVSAGAGLGGLGGAGGWRPPSTPRQRRRRQR